MRNAFEHVAVVIDTTDIYALVPKLETYRSEIATQVRGALAEGDAVMTT